MSEAFETGEWNQLRLLPFVVFRVVADVDGEVDAEEVKRMLHEVFESNPDGSELYDVLLRDLVNDPENTLDLFEDAKLATQSAQAIEKTLASARSLLLERLSPGDYRGFQSRIVEMAKHIARASGSRLDRTSQEEDLALGVITAFFEEG